MSRINVTLKGGAGHNAPWITVEGETVEEVRAAVVEVGDFKVEDHVTLLELVPAAASWLEAAYTAVTKLGGPPAIQPAVNVDIPQVEEPPATEVSLEEQVKQAASADQLNSLWADNKDKWTKKMTDLAKKRRAELEKENAA